MIPFVLLYLFDASSFFWVFERCGVADVGEGSCFFGRVGLLEGGSESGMIESHGERMLVVLCFETADGHGFD